MFRILLWIVLAFIVARLVWRLLGGVFQGMGYQSGGSGSQSVGLVRDPICGMYVVPSNALTSGSGSATRYFCSEKCRQEYARIK
jgi:YHS domain-containing protein